MKCLNPACGSLNADELNVTLNMSETDHGEEEPEYSGTTHYAIGSNIHLAVGTTCMDCDRSVFYDDWLDQVSSMWTPDLVVWSEEGVWKSRVPATVEND